MSPPDGPPRPWRLINFIRKNSCSHVRFGKWLGGRDIAILGLIHRTTLGKGPPQFQKYFKQHRHNLTLHDPRSDSNSPLIKRSALGLVAIYNMLPLSCRSARSVSAFQKSLQEIVTKYAVSGYPQWSDVFSPRLCLTSHPIAMHVH